MTGSDVSRIVITVAMSQLFCDLIAHWTVFQTERYERALSTYERAKRKKEKAQKEAVDAGVLDLSDPRNPVLLSGSSSSNNTSSTDKTTKSGKGKSSKDNNSKGTRSAKAYERADQEFSDAASLVSSLHVIPSIGTSFVFVILMRVMGAEYKGQIMGILPFTPWALVRRITARGLEFSSALVSDDPKVNDTSQAVSFFFIYLLASLSVKYYVNLLVGTPQPPGAGGFKSFTQSTWGKRVLDSFGIDPKELKVD